MNGRTSKLINRVARLSGFSRKSLKRGWLKTPRNKRNQNRKAMEQEI